MKKEIRTARWAMLCLVAFVFWTVAVRYVDVQPIGPKGSFVGFATINGYVHRLVGVHFPLYTITDWLGLVPVGVALSFAVMGLAQWIQRKRIGKVDADIRLLGGFLLAVFGIYLLFEYVVINYRPVLVEGRLETSYPSSTTMLALSVMPAALTPLRRRMRYSSARRWITVVVTLFTLFMVLGRLVSGVHWLTDIVGGVLCSGGLVLMYRSICNRLYK